MRRGRRREGDLSARKPQIAKGRGVSCDLREEEEKGRGVYGRRRGGRRRRRRGERRPSVGLEGGVSRVIVVKVGLGEGG